MYMFAQYVSDMNTDNLFFMDHLPQGEKDLIIQQISITGQQREHFTNRVRLTDTAKIPWRKRR